MKLGAITDEISMDLDRALSVISEYGCEGAELRTIWDVNIADLEESQLAQAKKLIDARGIEVCCIASPVYKCDLPGATTGRTGPMHQASAKPYEEHLDLLKHCCRIAREFGTTFVRIFSFWDVGVLDDGILDAVAAGISDGVKYAEDNGFTLLMENEAACIVKTGSELARIVERVDSPALRAVWDPGNAFLAGEVPYPDGYSAVRRHCAHVHVKDAVRLASGKEQFAVVGDGEVDYEGQFAALRDDGYTGYISLETHYRPFAGTAEQASRLCLQSLNRLLGRS